jgi:hypothetical protein
VGAELSLLKGPRIAVFSSSWPPHKPDLFRQQIFLYGCLKAYMYAARRANIPDFKQIIQQCLEVIYDDLLHHVMPFVRLNARVQSCRCRSSEKPFSALDVTLSYALSHESNVVSLNYTCISYFISDTIRCLCLILYCTRTVHNHYF